jgi:hypothetical protein
MFLLHCFCRFTYAKYFVSVIKELIDIAGQHESIAENVTSQVVTDLQQLVHTLRQDRKRVGYTIKLLYVMFCFQFVEYGLAEKFRVLVLIG